MNINATNVKLVKAPQIANAQVPNAQAANAKPLAGIMTMPVANKAAAVGCGCDNHGHGDKHQSHGQKLGKR